MAAPLGLETPEQRGIFVTYMALWVGYGLLNELAKRRGVVFNSTSAVVLQSLLKLALASYMFLTTEARTVSTSLPDRIRYLLSEIRAHRNLLVLYFIPAGLYVVYDVLAYVNLRRMDAPTYFLLLQFRLVVTGLLHQFMFQRKLNRHQWLSLAVTTVGCTIKTLGGMSNDKNSHEAGPSASYAAYALLMVQMLSSTFAGVYNELLLKKQASIAVNLQNIFMYLDSIACTVAMLALGLTGQSLSEVIRPDNLSVLFSLYVLPMVLIMSVVGVVTSLFLKRLDSIRKAIASALELVVLPILSAVLFGVPITLATVVAVGFVGFGVYIYSVPVASSPTAAKKPEKESPDSAEPKKANDLESGGAKSASD